MTPEEPTTLRDQLEDAVDQTIQDPTPEVNAPETWDDEAKGYFNGIQDPKARQWLVKRDTDYTTKLSEAEKRENFDPVFQPYDDRLKQSGQTRSQVITNLLQAQTVLETKPVEGLAWLVKTYGIKPEQVLQALNIKAPAADPNTPDPNAVVDPYADLDPALADKLRAFDAFMAQSTEGQRNAQERETAQMRTNLATKATEFRETKDAAGQLLYPHMADPRVVDEMSKLLKSSIVKVEGGDVLAAYKNAYERAIYAFPDIKEKMFSVVDQDRVNRARRAGASPRPDAGASRATPKVGNSVREQLKAAYDSGQE
jgi:hypothetical protein